VSDYIFDIYFIYCSSLNTTGSLAWGGGNKTAISNKLAQYVGGTNEVISNDIVIGLRAERPKGRGSLPGRDKIFVRSPKVHTGFVARTPSHSVSRGNSFPDDKGGRCVELATTTQSSPKLKTKVTTPNPVAHSTII
jgi:hypothetical protein